MHAFSIVTLGIFVAGYSTARWDLVTRLYELAIFAWDHGVVTRAAKGFAILSIFFFLFILPIERIAAHETDAVSSSIRKAEQMLTRDSIHDRQAAAYLLANSSSDAARSSWETLW